MQITEGINNKEELKQDDSSSISISFGVATDDTTITN